MPSPSGTPPRELVLEFDALDLEAALAQTARFGLERYGYVVTANIDHLVRWHEDADFRECYRAASCVLLDSRVAARLIRLTKGLTVPVCPGSDLTAALLTRSVRPADRIVFIGGSTAQAADLAARCALSNVRHYNPPMGFIADAAATQQCLEFIEAASPFRYCFLAVGSPQQELLARLLGTRARARGLALCVGASLNFLTGAERRAPRWMQRAALEWLYRLGGNPRRLARRYLLRGPRGLGYLAASRVRLRAPAAPQAQDS